MLKINNLSANIDNKSILKNFSLEVNPGEVHAIMGPNGAGLRMPTHARLAWRRAVGTWQRRGDANMFY